jgi:hypothetical protein
MSKSSEWETRNAEAIKPKKAKQRCRLHKQKMKDAVYADGKRRKRREWYLDKTKDPVWLADRRMKSQSYQKKLRETSPEFKMKCLLRLRMWQALKGKAISKKSHFIQSIGCSIERLVAHVETNFLPGMSWDNHGKGKGRWSVDHIWPMSKWNLNSAAHQMMCNHFTNIQPMWDVDNIRKSNKIS